MPRLLLRTKGLGLPSPLETVFCFLPSIATPPPWTPFGCGTTVAVSQRLRRDWIGIDIACQSIAVILKRLDDSFVATALEFLVLDGIPRDRESASLLVNKQER